LLEGFLQHCAEYNKARAGRFNRESVIPEIIGGTGWDRIKLSRIKSGRRAASSLSKVRLISSGSAPGDGQTPQDRCQNVLYVIGGANVAGACFHGGDPQILIRNAMSAHNRQRGKIMAQALHIGQPGIFHIEDHGLRPAVGDVLAEFVSGARQVNHTELGGKFTGERLCDPGIAFKDNYSGAHRSS
jgi:hypothetical protein